MRALLLILFVFLPLVSLSASDDWKPHKYDKDEYLRAYNIYYDHFDDTADRVEDNLLLADSIYATGLKSDNYTVMVVAEWMKECALATANRLVQSAEALKRAMAIARKYGDIDMYFQSYYRYCTAYTDIDASIAFMESKKMVAEAKMLNRPEALSYAHQALGDVCIYSRKDGETAVEEYEEALRYVENNSKNQVRLFDMSLMLAEADILCGRYEHADSIFRHLRSMDVFEDDYCAGSYYTSYIKFADATGDDVRFDSIYNAYFANFYAKSRFTDESMTGFRIDYLTKHSKFDEALACIDSISDEYNRQEFLYKLYEKKGDEKLALSHYKRLMEMRDSIQRKVNLSDIELMDVQLHNAELTLESQRAKASRNLFAGIGLTFIFVFVSLVLLFLFRSQRTANLKLTKANQVKENFIKNMTHELRTPINHLNGFAQLIGDDSVISDESLRKEMSSAIVNGSQSLVQMIDDLIDISALDSMTEAPEMTEVGVDSILDNASDTFRTLRGESMDITLKLDADNSSSLTVKTDMKLVGHIFKNLLSNAIKFSEGRGEVVIGASASDDSSYVVFRVSDQGKKIRPENYLKVFERFFKEDEFIPGAGLGLSYCQSAIEILGGTIKVDETMCQNGTTITFTLPLK